jgi:hypothetical protein
METVTKADLLDRMNAIHADVTRLAQPERPVTELELAGENARMKRALTGRQRPRTLHAVCEQSARLIPCTCCGQVAGRPCDGWGGYHLARFVRAYLRHLMTAAEWATVLGDLDVFTSSTIIRDGEL